MSVSKDTKRSSDYRSHTHAKVTLQQGATPEGLCRILDALNESTSKALEINQAIIQSKIGSVAANAVETGDQPRLQAGDDKAAADTPAKPPAE